MSRPNMKMIFVHLEFRFSGFPSESTRGHVELDIGVRNEGLVEVHSAGRNTERGGRGGKGEGMYQRLDQKH